MTILLVLAVAFLAYANGANDNFKGVASLFGSETTAYRSAITWATVTTLAGSVTAIFLAQSLLVKFSGKGLVPDALAGSQHFLLAVAVGAGATVILATVAGFPISTTHALVGAMVGGGWVAAGAQVHPAVLGRAFILPLLLSPVLALALGATLYLGLRWVRLRAGISKEWCVRIGAEQRAVAMDAAHFLSAGVVSFARGLNDTPKMAALLLVLPALGRSWGLVAVATAIAAGGLLSARRVAETMSHRITELNHGQGFSANLATGLLVVAASLFGLPVSTTHVSVGSLFGIGVLTRRVDHRVLRHIVLSWLITMPCGAVLGATIYLLVTRR